VEKLIFRGAGLRVTGRRDPGARTHLFGARFRLAGSIAAGIVLVSTSCAAFRPASGLAKPSQTIAPTPARLLSGTATERATKIPPQRTPTAEPTVTPQPTSPQAIDQLTGLPVSDPSVLSRPVVAIKVSNYPRTARPQAGLSYADLLFEYYQEGGETRFQALYLSQDVTKVGPIRSGRIVDALLQKMYQSILVFNGADSRVWDWFALQNITSKLYEGPAPCPALCREYTPTAPGFPAQAQINSLYGNTAALRKAAVAVGIPSLVPVLKGMVFSVAPPAGGKPATDLLVRFLTDNARAEWRYDPGTDKYLRWSETDSGGMAPLTDRLNGQQLSVSNLIVVSVPFNRRHEPDHIEMYDVNLLGAGGALFFRDSQEWQGTWRVADPNRPLQFFGENGPFALHPGVTWIALVGESSTSSNIGDSWRVEFALP